MNTPRVLVIGAGPAAQELAAAYRHLGWRPAIGTVEDAQRVGPQLVVVADGGVDTKKLNELSVPVVPTPQACDTAFDRANLRRKASEELGLPTLTHELARTPEEFAAAAERIGYPLIVKPCRGRGQTVYAQDAPVPQPFPECGLMLERYIEFDFEVTILTARSVDPATGQLATWFCEPIGTRHEGGRLVEAWQPAPLSEMAMGNARSIAARITGALECCGLYAIELFVDGEEVYFSQALPIVGLDGTLTRATQRLDQFELFARASVQFPIDVTLTSPGALRLVHVDGGVSFDRLSTAMATAMAVEETGVQILGEPVSAVLVRSTGDTVEEARERAARAAAAFGG